MYSVCLAHHLCDHVHVYRSPVWLCVEALRGISRHDKLELTE